MQIDLARHAAQLPAATEWRTMMEMADVFLKSGFLPDAIKTPAAAVTIIQKGRELGLPPLYALSIISIIKGKPVCGAEGMLAMIYRDHGDGAVQILETNAKECRIAYKRRGGERGEFAFTIADAERAGLARQDNYVKYTPAMLRARCISAMARMAFPDTIGGLYTPEEMGARVIVDADGQVVLDDEGATEETQQALSAASLYTTLYTNVEDSTTLEELQRAWLEVQGSRDQLTDVQRSALLALKNERRKDIEAAPEPVPTA